MNQPPDQNRPLLQNPQEYDIPAPVLRGPIRYHGSCILVGYCFFLLYWSIFCKVFLFLALWSDDIASYGNTPIQNVVFNAVIVVMAFNVWQLSFIWKKDYHKIPRFFKTDPCHLSGFWFCLVDIGFLVAYPWIVEIAHLKPEIAQRHHDIAFWCCLHLIALHLICLFLVFFFDYRQHYPFERSYNYHPFRKYEENAGEYRVLSVTQSSPFLITIKNVNPENRLVHGTIFVKRTVQWQEKGFCGIRRRNESVCFILDIHLAPGRKIHITPQTHHMEGAIPIMGYRSFGRERGATVVTSISTATSNDIEDHEDHPPFVALVEMFTQTKVEVPYFCV